MTDEEIIRLASHPITHEEGFKHLVMKYQQRLYSIIRRKVSSHEDADDILQNTFIKIFRHIKGYEGRSELFTWMYRIASNEIINYQKSLSRMNTVALENHDVHTADAYFDSDDLTTSFELVVSGLPDRQQMVFRMRYFDELSYKQIAELLKVTEGALKASFHHAVRKIEEEFRAKQIL
jgi:RNA polymerase sigma-70 factor (ECF subfamily)